MDKRISDPLFGVVGALDLLESITECAEIGWKCRNDNATVEVPVDEQDVHVLRWAVTELRKHFYDNPDGA